MLQTWERKSKIHWITFWNSTEFAFQRCTQHYTIRVRRQQSILLRTTHPGDVKSTTTDDAAGICDLRMKRTFEII